MALRGGRADNGRAHDVKRAMEIRIAIQTTDPLTGTATAEGEDPVNFEGWLEMLRALSTLVGTGGAASEGKRSR